MRDRDRDCGRCLGRHVSRPKCADEVRTGDTKTKKSLAQLIRRSRAAREGAVLLPKHLDSRVALGHLAQGSAVARARCLEVARMFHLERKLSAQYRPSCFFSFVPREVCLRGVVSIECGLQAETLGGVEYRCFV